MKKYTIDVSKWRTGEGGPYRTGKGPTLLKNRGGYSCCLGFILKQDGYNVDSLGEPYQLTIKDGAEHFLINHIGGNSKLSNDAIEINDCETTTIEEKMEELTELFSEHDIELEFVNG